MISGFKKLTGLLAIIALSGCAGDMEAKVGSADLIDQEVEYAVSESREAGTEAEPSPSVPVVAEAMPVVTPEAAASDGIVDFTEDSYTAPVFDMEFENAVREAQIKRGIDPSRAPARPAATSAATAAKAEFSGKLDVPAAPEEKQREGAITFLSTVVYHSRGQADMSAKDMSAIREVARFAKANNARIRVVGHASSRTRDMKEAQNKLVNFDLSIKRASTVRDALAANGIRRADIAISGVSDTESVAFENMPINEAVNRRTEIYIEY